jgi:membrane-associated protease RseP (regulator of RpoE activity)
LAAAETPTRSVNPHLSVRPLLSIGWYVTFGLILLYILFVVWLVQTDRMRRWNLSLMLGFALMIRTTRGKTTIETLSKPKRLWNIFGDLAVVVTLLGMALMVFVLVLTLVVALQPDSGVTPLAPSEILVIPGVNPFVPLWYGLIALIVTLVVHEGGHGILARANNIRVKSLGLLVAVVPIGAFVEPDEEDVKQSSRRRRLRVFAAGPGVNLLFAGIFLAAFVAMTASAAATPGIHIAATTRDAPADLAGIKAGDSLLAMDGRALTNYTVFSDTMAAHRPGDTIAFTLDGGRTLTVVVESYWSAALDDSARNAVLREEPAAMARHCSFLQPEPTSGAACAERLQQRAFLGISPLLPERLAWVQKPFGQNGVAFLTIISLPIGEVRGAPYFSVYLPSFFDTPFDAAIFWPVATLFFWIFWINLMVGLTNVLPIGILDGGHIFRDAAGGVLQRLRPAMPEERRDRVVGGTARIISFVVFGAFLMQIIGPYLMR